ncbi:MAG TPA: hypothetical protein VHA56_08980 [Mucilaginibacter sp.]|nr:hypothetical protein [Mucilaginibacter sp.]
MKRICWLYFLLCVACTQGPKAPAFSIKLTNDNQSLKFSGLDPAVLNDISRDTASAVWQNLIPVYKMPADTSLKSYQPVQPGKYVVQDSTVIFTPDTPLIKGAIYFMRFYNFKGAGIWDYIKQRRKLGKEGYTDLKVTVKQTNGVP